MNNNKLENIGCLSDYFVNTGIKELWHSEEKDLSPWIANNMLDKLGDIIEHQIIDFELEKGVGRYEADIVLTLDDDSKAIIENKIGTFDHDHLGKALTYMAYLGAKNIIWICDNYYDEHITAINYMNNITPDEFGFYAIKIQLCIKNYFYYF